LAFNVFVSFCKLLFSKVAGFVSGNRVPEDLYHEFMDLYCFGDHKTNPDFKRFNLNRWPRIQQIFKDSTCFHKSSRIFSTIPQNESFKIQICNSWFLTDPDWRICESISLNIWFVDSFWKNKNPQILDSYWFVGIRPWIPQPYHYL
jgi:hypothetical protein